MWIIIPLVLQTFAWIIVTSWDSWILLIIIRNKFNQQTANSIIGNSESEIYGNKFNYITNDNNSNKIDYNILAQEVEQLLIKIKVWSTVRRKER